MSIPSKPTPRRGARSAAPAVDALPYFAAAAPGLEPLVLAELQAIGVAGARAEAGGVSFGGGDEALYRANMWLRTASRVVLRVARFHAEEFHELERNARKVEWERFVAPGSTVRFRVTCRKSKLYHSDAVAQRVAAAIAYRLKGGITVVGDGAAGDDEGDDAPDASVAQLFTVRLTHDECVISADGSGELLHRRGYRQAVAKAPLRETLAAAALAGAGWTATAPLVDPMCGAGTIAIEAALIARDIAPGLGRDFAFMRWPTFDAARWARLGERAAARVQPAAPAPILASDRDEGAIEAARSNAARAGVEADIELSVRPISAIEPPESTRGWVVTNPPYGVRIGEQAGLRNLYAGLGRTLRERCVGWELAMVSADRALEGQVGVRFREAFRTSNGGIPVRLVVGTVEERAVGGSSDGGGAGGGKPGGRPRRGPKPPADEGNAEGEGFEYL